MYVTRAETTVVAGRAGDYEERAKRLGELVKSQRGFQGRLLLNSFGYPGKWATLTFWESREAARAWARSPQNVAFIQANPLQGISTLNRPAEAYAVIHDVSSSGEPGSVNLLDIALDVRPGNAAAYEASRKELFELRKKHWPGFVSDRLLRFLGGPNKYLIVRQLTSREALPAPQPVPETQAYNAAHPITEWASTPNITERYEVMQRL